MAFVFTPSRRFRAPRYPFTLRPEWERSLISFYAPQHPRLGFGAWDLTRGSTGHEDVAPGIGYGGAFGGTNTTDRVYNDSGTKHVNGYPCTCLARFVTYGATAGVTQTIGMLGAAADHRAFLYIGATALAAGAKGSSTSSSSTISTVANGVPISGAGLFSAVNSRTVYMDGVAASASTANIGTVNDLTYLSYGSYKGSSETWVFNGVISYVAWYDRAFTAAEILEWARYPYLWVGRDSQRQVFLLGPAAGGAVEQTLTPSLFANDNTFYSPTVTTGAVTLTPSLFANDNTFYSPAVTTGAVTLTPELFANAETFYSPTVSQGAAPQELTPSLFANDNTFYSPAVTTGAVTLSPSLVTDADTFHAATVTNGLTLQPSLVTDADTFYAPTVTRGTVTLAPSLVTDSDTFHAATVSQDGATQTLTPSLVADSDTFHAPTITRGTVTLTPSLVTDSDVFHSATVTNGVALQPGLVADADTFYAPTVARGAVTLSPALVVNSQSFYVPTVSSDGSPQTLTASRLINDATIYAHEVVRQIFAGEATDSRHRARVGSPVASTAARVGAPVVGPKRRVGTPRL